ncbi:uncharacterized protein LOC127729708 [Mytilus californianus]|uniref:uncharacterized protein LOC127729708 n=1 Tax=Mytilus californianus TaxID=6549 RepID=UPI002246F7D9|nr:uncharacterized protein LOC127729708 [Mytilus californianus]
MDLTNGELSLQIYHYLCDVVSSGEVVDMRRRILLAQDYVLENQETTYISSGSKAEGLDLEGSDYDQMFVDKHVGVYEGIHDIARSAHGLTLLMDTNDTKAGFTKLKIHKASYRTLSFIISCCEIFEMEPYVSSKLFLESMIIFGNDLMIIHGPCISSNADVYDGARCFRFKEWIKPAHQWIYRSKCTWPDYELTQSVVQYGVLFVTIGCKGSVNEDLEWRISFSVAERQLIFSFSHTQLLCYALMKILLKDVIKQELDDLICSYFLKTIMFWLCEESACNKWKAEHFVRCFMSCLRRLIYCVEFETCLHYFIPENNLFEGRFSFEQHKALLDTLYDIYHSPWRYVFYSVTFENYRKAQINSFSSNMEASSLS